VWLAQAIMYPSLAHIERDAFVSWHRKYSSRIAFFVIPLLCGQGNHCRHHDIPRRRLLDDPFRGNHCLVLGFHIRLSVPCHVKLQRSGKDLSVIRRLVWTNLIRTILWSLVFLIAFGALYSVNPTLRGRPDGSSRTEATVRISKILLVREHNSSMERKRVEPGPGQESVWITEAS